MDVFHNIPHNKNKTQIQPNDLHIDVYAIHAYVWPILRPSRIESINCIVYRSALFKNIHDSQFAEQYQLLSHNRKAPSLRVRQGTSEMSDKHF